MFFNWIIWKKGDSGGPAVVKVGDKYFQVGVVSYGSQFCDGIYLVYLFRLDQLFYFLKIYICFL